MDMKKAGADDQDGKYQTVLSCLKSWRSIKQSSFSSLTIPNLDKVDDSSLVLNQRQIAQLRVNHLEFEEVE